MQAVAEGQEGASTGASSDEEPKATSLPSTNPPVPLEAVSLDSGFEQGAPSGPSGSNEGVAAAGPSSTANDSGMVTNQSAALPWEEAVPQQQHAAEDAGLHGVHLQQQPNIRPPHSGADHGLNLLALALIVGIVAILLRKFVAAAGDTGLGDIGDLEYSL